MVGLLSVAFSAHSEEVLVDFNSTEGGFFSEATIQNVTFSTNVGSGFQLLSGIDFPYGFLTIENVGESLRFDFESPISSFSFDMVGETTSASTNQQRLDIFNVSGEQIGSTLEFINVRTGTGFSSSFTDISYATLSGVGGIILSDSVLISNFKYTEVSPVPEPSTYALMLGGLGLVGFMAYRRKKVLS